VTPDTTQLRPARTDRKLTALTVARINAPGSYPDGGGLYVRVNPSHTRSWLFRYTLHGKPHWMGLGSTDVVTLAEARQKALAARQLLADGLDPLEARRDQRTRERLDSARSVTFADCVESYISTHRAGWRNAKHAAQWGATLRSYAWPIKGLPVQAVDTALVLKVLEPIWSAKPETASRVRQRIERVLDYAKVSGLREGENPARWRGHLDHLLPPLSKVQRVEHHAAMPYEAVPAFVAKLRVQEGIAPVALEFAILTAARTGEVLGARWGEIDLGAAVWTVPAGRMKAGRAHRVPLPRRAVELLTELRGEKPPAPDDLVFPGLRPGRPLSNMAMLALLRRFKLDVTVHGFRSSFRTWAAERSAFPTEVVEMALAHTIRSAVVAAYQRGDLFEKRVRLMKQWAAFLEKPARGAVVPMRGTNK